MERFNQRREATATAAYDLVREALSPRERIPAVIASLPTLRRMALKDIDVEEPCPICLVPLSTVLTEDELRDEGGKADDGTQLTGVTKLVGCGHIFCRRDLTEWIRSQHGSCPTCRHVFLDILPLSDSDDESSDGGEYVPNPEDFDDDDDEAFLDVDGFTDTDADADDFPVEGMDLDFDEFWSEDGDAQALGVEPIAADGLGNEVYPFSSADTDMGDDEYNAQEDEEFDVAEEWGLTDGESESMSSSDAGDLSMDVASGVLDREVSVSAHADEVPNFEQDEGLSINADGALAASRSYK